MGRQEGHTHTHTHTHTQTQGERQCYGWPHRRWGPRAFDWRWWSWSHVSRSTRGRRRRRRATCASACWTGHFLFYKFGLQILQTCLYVIRPAISLRKIWVGIYECSLCGCGCVGSEGGWMYWNLWIFESLTGTIHSHPRRPPRTHTHTWWEHPENPIMCDICVAISPNKCFCGFSLYTRHWIWEYTATRAAHAHFLRRWIFAKVKLFINWLC
jgi:hypothetical protein